MVKSADAFRTISEVADWLETPAHVLRFWESKFSHVKPVKRAGGRRYYRPSDMLLLGGIKKLLHDDGMTIKGVQKILRQDGVQHVANLSQPLDEVTAAEASDIALDVAPAPEAPRKAKVLDFQRDPGMNGSDRPAPPTPPMPEMSDPIARAGSAEGEDDLELEETVEDVTETNDSTAEESSSDQSEAASATDPQTEKTTPEPVAQVDQPEEEETASQDEPAPEPLQPDPSSEASEISDMPPEYATPEEPSAPQPSFASHRESVSQEASDAQASEPTLTPAPAKVDVPDDPGDDMTVPAGVLTALTHLKRPIPLGQAAKLSALHERLLAIRGGDAPTQDK